MEMEIREVEIKGKALSSVRKPYECAMTDDWEGLKRFYEDNVMEVVENMTTKNDTGLHVAALAGRKDVLEFLISLIKDRALPPLFLQRALIMENNRGDTPLHEVAASGNLDAAKLLVKEEDAFDRDVESSYERLVEIKNHLGETPLYRAAAFGHTNLVQYLASQVRHDIEQHFQRNDQVSILHIAVLGQHFETAHWLVKTYRALTNRKEKKELTSLQLLAQMPSAFKPKFRKSVWIKLHRHIYSGLCNDDDIDRDPANQNDDLESIFNQPSQSTFSNTIMRMIRRTIMGEEMQNQNVLLELTDFLVQKDYSWAEILPTEVVNTFSLVSKPNNNNNCDCDCRDGGETTSTYEYIPLFIATRTGISQIVEKILKFHPQAVEAHDIKRQQNILHIAIKYRRLAIFNIVKKSKFITSRLADMIDSDRNTILHHAADMSYYSVDTKGTYGPAFQLQEELLWMSRVQKIIPAYYNMHRNNEGVTAEELFSSQHAKLLKSAKAWIKQTAQSGSVVAALVATVAYTAAYTVPGGTNKNGLPNLQHSPVFKAFTISNTVSLIFSLTSLGTFLNITRSPFEYKNFHHSLPLKLDLGFLLLFCSLLVSMLTFAATIVLLIHHQNIWSISIIYVVVAILPFSVFGLNHNRFYEVFFKGLKYIKKKLRCQN